ncbi:YidC/Oxa1 family membrane protein insertase [Fusibacter paucivorans]|jgi:YidC/Oxa1 family membrane protein insertase|uniref:YidC/Oxa1 family membrane protein insertase n=1 Tax=Fusibacter paucivorans TaxID=76009 RepID=A0ABS5PRA8_9FIRM|nr:YidC/Oxa1 family membrane protein insertase [Fusibacter paucivorans]MBS7527116.1 YidC/Oxa1 family membrane protein insertase [Fusibacter paucivorans]
MLDFISIPMGFILKFIYDNIAFQNYGIAIVLFTVGVKTLLLPLTIKQVKSTSKMSALQSHVQEIQKKYSNDKEKQSAEMIKLYQKNKVNPAGGCLPILIQMPILFSLYYVISEPLKYMMGKSAESINQIYALIPSGAENMGNIKDLNIINYFSSNPEQLSNVSYLLKAEELLNMNFFGVNLGVVPSWIPSNYFAPGTDLDAYLLLLIPLMSGLTSYISVRYSMKDNLKASDNKLQASMQNNMIFLSPIMSGIITFTVPAGLGLYWITGNIYQILQQVFIDIFVFEKYGLSSLKKKI